MRTIKERNGMDLTEAEDIKKTWQEYTEELYKKDLHDPDNSFSYLEPVCSSMSSFNCYSRGRSGGLVFPSLEEFSTV